MDGVPLHVQFMLMCSSVISWCASLDAIFPMFPVQQLRASGHDLWRDHNYSVDGSASLPSFVADNYSIGKAFPDPVNIRTELWKRCIAEMDLRAVNTFEWWWSHEPSPSRVPSQADQRAKTIGFLLMSHRLCCRVVECGLEANLACGSDHKPLFARLALQPGQRRLDQIHADNQRGKVNKLPHMPSMNPSSSTFHFGGEWTSFSDAAPELLAFWTECWRGTTPFELPN
eukprot:1986311-Amphidinium_carterae.2